MSKKIGIMIGLFQKKYGEKEALRIAKQCGADAVDFSIYENLYDCTDPNSIYAKSDEQIKAYFTDIKNYANELGLVISQTHGRLVAFCHNDPGHNEVWKKNIRIDCMVTAVLGAPVCVIHAMNTSRNGVDFPAEKMRSMNTRMFDIGLKYAKEYGIKLATETFGDAPKYGVCDFFGQIDEFKRSIEDISAIGDNGKHLAVCADTGHSNKAMRFGNPAPADVIRAVGDRVKVLHLNDNNTLTDQHKMPFSGTIDWDDVFDALDEIGYNGVYNMELELAFYGEELAVETAEFAIKVLRNYLNKRYGS